MILIKLRIVLVVLSCLVLTVENVHNIIMHTKKVIVGRDYILALQNPMNGADCYYRAPSTNISGHFMVNSKGNRTIPPATPEIPIVELADYGICGIIVRNADPSGPSDWIIEAKRHGKTLTIVEFEIMFIKGFSTYPSTKRINVAIGAKYKMGFLPYPNITKCRFTSNTGITFAFDLKDMISAQSLGPFTKVQDTDVNKIFHLGNLNQCIILAENVKSGGPTSWTVTASDEVKDLRSETFSVSYYSSDTLIPTPLDTSTPYLTKRDRIILGFERHEGIDVCEVSTLEHGSASFTVRETLSLNQPAEQFDLFSARSLHFGKAGLCKIILVNDESFEPHNITVKAMSEGYVITQRTFLLQYVGKNDLRMTPKGKVVHVLEGGEYSVGFEFHPGIYKCRMVESTGNNALQFRIGTKPPIQNSKDYNRVYYKSNRECKISVTNATTNGPKYWQVVAQTAYATIASEIFSVYVHSADSMKTIPKNPHIFISPLQVYSMGFERYQYITRCYYESISVSGRFEVRPDGRQMRLPLKAGTIMPRGEFGQCGITVMDGLSLPQQYTITAGTDTQNFTSVTFYVITYNRIWVDSSNIDVFGKQNIVQHFRIEDDKNFIKCVLQSDNVHIEFNPRTKQIDFTDERSRSIAERMSVLNGVPCGFKIEDFSETDIESRWYLIGTDEHTLKYGDVFYFTYVSGDIRRNIRKPVILAMHTVLQCHTPKFTFCELFDPKGNLIRHGTYCDYEIKSLSVEDLGTWTCVFGKTGSFQALNYTVELVNGEKSLTVQSKVYSCESRMCLSCEFSEKEYIDSCKMVSPSKESYIVSPGLSTDRFTSINSDLPNGICTIEIEKPLTPTERGTWMCELKLHEKVFGTTFQVDSKDTTIPDYKRNFNMTVRDQETLFIDCEVPYSTEHCYIKSPSGEAFFDQLSFQPQFGRCALTVPNDYKAKNGNWSCFFSKANMEKDEEIQIQVTAISFAADESVIVAEKASEVEMSCSAAGESLHFCLFVSPQNQSYHFHKSDKHPHLEVGKCAITIKELRAHDYGIWKCFAKLHAVSSPLSAEILLQNPDDLPASSRKSHQNSGNTHFGFIVLGLLAIAFVLGGAFVVYKKFVNPYFYYR